MSDALEAVVRQQLVGESTAICKVRREILRFGRSRLPILIQGPTGSGKELAARAIHLVSGRGGAFVPFNVCALGEGMFEDALFGHVRGAFTGAGREVSGYLAEANGGSLLLDEVSGLSLHAQAKLLRALETGAYRPIGASRDRVSDFRVLSASNEDMPALVKGRRFREDLLYRLGGHVVRIPALDARCEDIPIIARHFLSQAGTRGTAEALGVLRQRSWPGNVRELRHAVDRAILVANGREVSAAHVRLVLDPMSWSRSSSEAPDDDQGLLRVVLERYGWNTHRAAEALHVHRTTLYRRMRRVGLSVPTSAKATRGAPSAADQGLRIVRS